MKFYMIFLLCDFGTLQTAAARFENNKRAYGMNLYHQLMYFNKNQDKLMNGMVNNNDDMF